VPSPKTSPDERMMVFDLVRSEVAAGTFRGPSEFLRRHRGELPLPAKETIRRWSLDANSPYTGRNLFDGSPSPELSFFVGAWIGDGWADDNDGGKRLRLKVKSRDFAEEFARCASVVLKKGRPYRVWTTVDEGGTWYNAKVTSVDLYEFVDRDLVSIEPIVGRHPKSFLRGLYTAEGNPSVSVWRRNGPGLSAGVEVANTDVQLLELARKYLLELGFSPGRLRLGNRQGTKTGFGRATKDCWIMNLSRQSDVRRFLTEIGFADPNKQSKLTEASESLDELGPQEAARLWLNSHEKLGKRWSKKR